MLKKDLVWKFNHIVKWPKEKLKYIPYGVLYANVWPLIVQVANGFLAILINDGMVRIGGIALEQIFEDYEKEALQLIDESEKEFSQHKKAPTQADTDYVYHKEALAYQSHPYKAFGRLPDS